MKTLTSRRKKRIADIMDAPRERMIFELEQEEDGRWIAEVVEIPGAMAYGKTQDEAIARVEALALRVAADRLV